MTADRYGEPRIPGSETEAFERLRERTRTVWGECAGGPPRTAQEPACRWAHGVIVSGLDSHGRCPICAEDDDEDPPDDDEWAGEWDRDEGPGDPLGHPQ